MSLSVVIPVINEEKALSELLPFLKALEYPPSEIIVVDGGSSDNSKMIAIENGAILLESNREGRAAQLHLGAMNASNLHICFLHADTFPNPGFVNQIKEVMKDDRIALGGFISIMKGKKTRYWISYLNYVKTYFCSFIYSPKKHWKGLRLLFGDQVMFCRKSDYLESGGFKLEDRVMEEANFCLRMSALGRVKLVHQFVYSSDRRVSEWGFFKANRIYIGIAMGWALGLSTQHLEDQYIHVR